ncbi:MAG: hypothetical protein ACFFER_18765 [Candidatus Thorarchaeota archaeon]
MAFSAMAPSERSEHLIYIILPYSLSFYLVLILDLAYDPRIWVAFMTIIAPLFTVFLYELGIDEFLAKAVARWYLLGENSKPKLLTMLTKHRRIVEHNIKSFTEGEIRTAVGDALSSYPIRQKFWRLRATSYLMVSVLFLAFLPFISFTAPVMNDAGIVVFEKSPLISTELVSEWSPRLLLAFLVMFSLSLCITAKVALTNDYGSLRKPAILAAIAFGIALLIETLANFGNISVHWPYTFIIVLLLLIIAANLYRHRSLKSYVQNVVMFLSLFDLLANDHVRYPKQYHQTEFVRGVPRSPVKEIDRLEGGTPFRIEVGWKLPLKSHLEYLERVLVRGDWAVFLQSWNRILKTIDEQEPDETLIEELKKKERRHILN